MGKLLDQNKISACYVESGIDATAGCAELTRNSNFYNNSLINKVGFFKNSFLEPCQCIFASSNNYKFLKMF